MNKVLGTFAVIVIVAFCAGCGPGFAKTPQSDKADPVSTPATSPSVAGDDDKALFETSCKACHALKRVHEYNHEEAWAAIVGRMIKQHGAKVTQENADKIVAYLDKTYPKKP